MSDNQKDTNNLDKAKRLISLRSALNLTQAEFANRIGSHSVSISQMEKGKRVIGSGVAYRILSEFKVNPNWWENGDGDVFTTGINSRPQVPTRKPEHNADPLPYSPDLEYEKTSDGAEGVEYSDLGGGYILMTMPLVDQYAFAGYLAGYADVEYLEELPRHSIIVEKEYSGVYRGFKIRGDSMDDGSIHSFPDGTVAACRRIEREFYERNRLHLRKWQYFVIVHTEGIVLKEIVTHDVEFGKIHCHSLNPDKEVYPDFVIKMENVIEIYNVVQKLLTV